MAENNPIGEMLVAAGLLTQAALDTALTEHASTGKSLGRILIDRRMVTEGDLVSVVAQKMGMLYVDLAEYPVDIQAVMAIPAQMARRFNAIPVKREGNQLLVVMEEPSNVFAVDDIRTVTGLDIRTAISTKAAIVAALDKYYRADAASSELATQAAGEVEDDSSLANVKEATEDAPLVRFVNLLIAQAIQDRASDIHIEPTERDLRVRYRIDGVLHERQRPPKALQAGITSRLKIMADINIAERRIPQDGRITDNFGGKQMDLRVATLPTVYGEKIVMRILDTSGTQSYDLGLLGFLPETLEQYQQSFTKPYGCILVTGPTGAGKSMTLFATLNALNDESKNIITVEDPVEYRLAGINQVHVNTKAGMTFAAAMRSILRCDPDICLVGEMRDAETASIGIEMALTGHLVLSTLHTNDASSAPVRLIEMGVEPFLVASALDAIVAQRLARRLCEKCKEPYEPTDLDLKLVGWDFERDPVPKEVFRANEAGCSSCEKGYKGRFGIYEVLTVTEEIERILLSEGHGDEIERAAVEEGMIRLRRSGLIQVANGLTSFEEINRVIT